jgi:hypothetical protein
MLGDGLGSLAFGLYLMANATVTEQERSDCTRGTGSFLLLVSSSDRQFSTRFLGLLWGVTPFRPVASLWFGNSDQFSLHQFGYTQHQFLRTRETCDLHTYR